METKQNDKVMIPKKSVLSPELKVGIQFGEGDRFEVVLSEEEHVSDLTAVQMVTGAAVTQ